VLDHQAEGVAVTAACLHIAGERTHLLEASGLEPQATAKALLGDASLHGAVHSGKWQAVAEQVGTRQFKRKAQDAVQIACAHPLEPGQPRAVVHPE